MKGIVFSVFGLSCVLASLIYQTDLKKRHVDIKLNSNACFIVKRKVECAVACCTGDDCKGLYYGKPGLCQCKRDVSASGKTPEQGAFDLWMPLEKVNGNTKRTTKPEDQGTHFLICGETSLFWYRIGRRRYIAKTAIKPTIRSYEVQYVHSTNTLFWVEDTSNKLYSAVLSIGKIGPKRLLVGGNRGRSIQVDFDKDLIFWSDEKKLKSATLKGQKIKVVFSARADVYSVHVDKLNSRVYVPLYNGDLFLTNYHGNKRRLVTRIMIVSAFFYAEDQILYLVPEDRVRTQRKKKLDFKIMNNLAGRFYITVHRHTFYFEPNPGSMTPLALITAMHRRRTKDTCEDVLPLIMQRLEELWTPSELGYNMTWLQNVPSKGSHGP